MSENMFQVSAEELETLQEAMTALTSQSGAKYKEIILPTTSHFSDKVLFFYETFKEMLRLANGVSDQSSRVTLYSKIRDCISRFPDIMKLMRWNSGQRVLDHESEFILIIQDSSELEKRINQLQRQASYASEDEALFCMEWSVNGELREYEDWFQLDKTLRHNLDTTVAAGEENASQYFLKCVNELRELFGLSECISFAQGELNFQFSDKKIIIQSRPGKDIWTPENMRRLFEKMIIDLHWKNPTGQYHLVEKKLENSKEHQTEINDYIKLYKDLLKEMNLYLKIVGSANISQPLDIQSLSIAQALKPIHNTQAEYLKDFLNQMINLIELKIIFSSKNASGSSIDYDALYRTLNVIKNPLLWQEASDLLVSHIDQFSEVISKNPGFAFLFFWDEKSHRFNTIHDMNAEMMRRRVERTNQIKVNEFKRSELLQETLIGYYDDNQFIFDVICACQEFINENHQATQTSIKNFIYDLVDICVGKHANAKRDQLLECLSQLFNNLEEKSSKESIANESSGCMMPFLAKQFSLFSLRNHQQDTDHRHKQSIYLIMPNNMPNKP